MTAIFELNKITILNPIYLKFNLNIKHLPYVPIPFVNKRISNITKA